MLYITTRGNTDAFTAHRTLMTDRAPDGGLFIPMRFPQFSTNEIRGMIEAPFEAIVANIINQFFGTGITQWDVGFCFGRKIMRIVHMNSKIYFAELWHHPDNGIDYITNRLFQRIFGGETEQRPTEWFCIVIKTAFLFGIYGELCKNKTICFGDSFDLSVPADDFSYPMAILYASELGLPIGTVICNCVKAYSLWNLLHQGELLTAELDGEVSAAVERFLLLRLGGSMPLQLLHERLYCLNADEHEKLRAGLFCVVSGADRALQTMASTYSSSGKILTPDAALCIAGLGDFRAKTGESKFTLIIEENSPILYLSEVERTTGLTARKIGEYLKE